MVVRKISLGIFIPEDRRQALSRGEGLPARTNGAVLFADVSGFTQLTESFSSQLGPRRGIEALTQLLDPIYAELVNTIHSYQGSVIVISGDGMTCWFNQDDGSRATTCAFALQKVIARYDSIALPNNEKINLGIKIALSVGAVQRFLVGDPNIQLIETLAGHELDQVIAIHQSLTKGEVAISRDLQQKFNENISVVAWRQTAEEAEFAIIQERAKLVDPIPWPAIPELDDGVARKWIHSSVYTRLEGEAIEFLTEFRQGVPVFVKFTGIDYDHDENANQKLDQFIRFVQSILERYAGYLCQLSIGGENTNVYIAFGAPIAHEDNVDRALSAALKLVEEASQLNFIQPIRIGLTQGPLWAGAHGGGAARTYSVIGREVNLAYRLMSHAGPGQILVSPHVADTARNYSFVPLAPIQFKGVGKPMMPFVLMGRTKTRSRLSDRKNILGRDAERKTLTTKLEAFTRGNQSDSTGMVMIEGEAGIGKSRLLADFMKQAQQMNVRVLSGEADPIERSTHYYAFRSILGSIFSRSDVEDSQLMMENVFAALAQDQFLVERAPLLGEILPLHWPDNKLTSQMSGEARAASIREVVLGVLRNFLNASEARVVIVLDDAQWLDFATWNLLEHIHRELPAILLVLAMRSLMEEEIGAQIETVYQGLRANPATVHLPLTNLSLGETADLVAQRLEVRALPRYILEFIRVRSHGNPFFSEQAAYALRDSGIIHIESGEATVNYAVDELNRIDFPATVQGVITSRIDRLSPSQQLTLKVASVIGRVFLINMLANIHPAKIEADSLTEQLASLNRLGITDVEDPGPELTYFFRHAITQEVIYSLLTFAQRKQLHCAIAEWYENNHVADQPQYYSRLAHHWLNGEVIEKAIYFLDKAGEQALDLYSNEDVIRFISAAIELDQRSPMELSDSRIGSPRILRRARWERMLGMAHIKLTQVPEALQHYMEALRLLGRPMPQTDRALALALIKELLTQIARRFQNKKQLLSGENRNHEWEVELAHIDIEGALYFSQDVTKLAWGMLRRLNLAERTGMFALMAEGYSNVLMIAGFANNQRLINLYRRLTWEAVERANRTSTRMYALLRDGVASFVSCQWEQAIERFETGIQLADQLGDDRLFGDLTASFATALFLQGRYGESLERWIKSFQRKAKKDRFHATAWTLYGQGHNRLMLGQVVDAIRDLESGLNTPLRDTGDAILNTSLYGALSLAYLRNRQFDSAFETSIAHHRNATAPSTSSIICYYSASLDALLGLYEGAMNGSIHLGELENAQLRQLVDRIPKSLGVMKNLPANKASVWLYQGIYDNLNAKSGIAIAAWKKSLEYSRRFNQPYELARASYELGRHPKTDTPAQQQHLIKACEVFEALGTTYELILAKSALNKLTTVSTD